MIWRKQVQDLPIGINKRKIWSYAQHKIVNRVQFWNSNFKSNFRHHVFLHEVFNCKSAKNIKPGIQNLRIQSSCCQPRFPLKERAKRLKVHFHYLLLFGCLPVSQQTTAKYLGQNEIMGDAFLGHCWSFYTIDSDLEIKWQSVNFN